MSTNGIVVLRVSCPWPPESVSSSPVQTTPKYDQQPANQGDNSRKVWAKEVRDAQPEHKAKFCSSTRHASAGGANAWAQQYVQDVGSI